MSNELFVGNLAFRVDEDILKAFFEGAGSVESVKVIKDFQTGRSRGFGFVKMGTSEEAQKAISSLNGQDLEGRAVRVNLAGEGRAPGGDRGGERGGFRPRPQGGRPNPGRSSY